MVTGVGKSAIIGQKLVATLNSTGSKSVFMHAADAVHGDLGQIDKDDLVICLSKSGETAELKVLLPILKSMEKNLTIAMVSNEASFLPAKVTCAWVACWKGGWPQQPRTYCQYHCS